MVRYSLAAALVMLHRPLKVRAGAADSDAWSYLPVSMPTPLSDMGVVSLTLGEGGGNSTDSNDEVAKTRIILTGGCDSPEGNEERGNNFECGSLTNKAYAFDPIRHSTFQAWNGEFKELADMPRARARHASAVVNGRVCVYGGRNLTDALIAEVDCYDPAADEWSTPTSLPAERQASDLTAFTAEGDRVHLVGGYDQFYTALDNVTVVDMSDMDAVAYSDGPRLRTKRGDIDAAVVDGAVYVSGGFTHENDWAHPLNSVERFDPAVGQWSTVDALNDERGDKQLVALGGRVYALGGEQKVDVSGVPAAELPELGARSELLDSVEVLDPAEDVHGGLAQWRSLAGMPGQLFRFAAAEWEADGEFIFVLGGQVAYNVDCKCFRTTDKVMVFDVNHAEEEGSTTTLSGSGAHASWAIGASAFLRLLSAASTFIWLVF